MPFIITKVENGYKVMNAFTKRTYSKEPLTKEEALKQHQELNDFWYHKGIRPIGSF
jgi:hypothetical protein